MDVKPVQISMNAFPCISDKRSSLTHPTSGRGSGGNGHEHQLRKALATAHVVKGNALYMPILS
ncbi:hypothetical protein SESBI_13815 [Sesbania bispinosa]|nr:hypothetical protein SESBI_13815 [Sesbania bispinosa]